MFLDQPADVVHHCGGRLRHPEIAVPRLLHLGQQLVHGVGPDHLRRNVSCPLPTELQHDGALPSLRRTNPPEHSKNESHSQQVDGSLERSCARKHSHIRMRLCLIPNEGRSCSRPSPIRCACRLRCTCARGSSACTTWSSGRG